MANENTASQIKDFVATIYEGAVLTARENSIVSPLVRFMGDSQNNADRYFSQYTGGTVGSNITENTDLSSQAFTPVTVAKLTPYMYGMQYYLTDWRIASDPFQLRADAAKDLGEALATDVDTHFTEDFASLTGGTVGSAGGTITWANFIKAISLLRVQKAPQPYFCVLAPGQWYYLANTIAAGATVTNAPALQDAVARQFFAANAYGVDIYLNANITAGTASKGAMFSRDAMGFDVRRAYRLEYERDASRGGGGWELNSTMIYAHGVWRAEFGVQMIGSAVLT